jgi:hypothetical protein
MFGVGFWGLAQQLHDLWRWIRRMAGMRFYVYIRLGFALWWRLSINT